MKESSPITVQSSEFTKEVSNISNAERFDLIRDLDAISSVVMGSFYVMDVVADRICYMSPNSLFLCDYSVNTTLISGNDFYKKIIHPDDLPLWEKMHRAVLMYLKGCKEKHDRIDYFSCTFRLQRTYSFLVRPLSQMICHRMKPVWTDGILRYLICSAGSSAGKQAGNLRMYCKDGCAYEEYCTTTQRWKRTKIEPLTEREKAVLVLAGQGKSAKEIARDLCKAPDTIRNQIKSLFSKLNVHSMFAAIVFTSNHRMINIQKQDTQQFEQFRIEVPRKRIRKILSPDMLQCIQQHLCDGKSIRQAAKWEGVAESAVRYWLKQGNLKK